ncbi:MAG: hypothetical protein MHM6MM_004418 [Cercozoa sp. M6MM]
MKATVNTMRRVRIKNALIPRDPLMCVGFCIGLPKRPYGNGHSQDMMSDTVVLNVKTMADSRFGKSQVVSPPTSSLSPHIRKPGPSTVDLTKKARKLWNQSTTLVKKTT